MSKYKIRKNDAVIILAGKDKGKKGKVLKVDYEASKVLVKGLNLAIKHVKVSEKLPEGGRISKEMPIHVSNVSHIDPKTDRACKVGYKFLADGQKVRYSRRSGEIIEKVTENI